MSATQTRISHQNLPEQVLIKSVNSPTAKMLLPQTHSRSRAMVTSITKIALPSCLWMFFFLFHLHSGSHATCTSILVEKQHYDVHADLQMLYHSVIS